jgi:hypothetical protein
MLVFLLNFIFALFQQISPTTDDQVFMKTLTYGFAMVVMVFLPSFFGNELSAASEKVPEALFYSDWTDQSKNIKSAVKIFLENTKKPIKVTMLRRMITIDYAMFTSVCNFVYSLYGVLKKV